jgi:hypothetical protein
LVRAALLSARFYADAQTNPLLPYGGFGTMPIGDALDILIKDGKQDQEAFASGESDVAKGVTRWPTRLRVAAAMGNIAYQEVGPTTKRQWLDQAGAQLGADAKGVADNPGSLASVLARAGQDLENASSSEQPAHQGDEPDQQQLRQATNLRDQALDLAATTYEFDEGRAQAVFAEVAFTIPETNGPASAAATRNVHRESSLQVAENWNVDVTADGSATKIVASIDLRDEDVGRIAQVLDPAEWSTDSIFWYRSTPIDKEPIADSGGGWRGVLREVVAGMAIFTVDLYIEYRPNQPENLLQYRFLRSPDPITKDDGYIAIDSRDGVHKITVEKVIDFADNPFGGPSALDLLAPSYMASWLRVQQDQWMARLTANALARASAQREKPAKRA